MHVRGDGVVVLAVSPVALSLRLYRSGFERVSDRSLGFAAAKFFR